jgi:hypothetical protein
MKKRALVFLVLFVMSVNFCLAEIEIKIYPNGTSIESSYTTSSQFSGFLNFSMKNVPADAKIKSSLGGEISLRDFIKLNNKELSCESYNCSGVYLPNSSGVKTKTLNYPSENLFGFVIDGGKNVKIDKINFSLKSNFPQSDELPLILSLFDGIYTWNFDKASSDFTRLTDYGCFSPSAPKENPSLISTTRYCERMDYLPGSKTYKMGALVSGSGNTNMIMTLLDSDFIELGDCKFNANSTNNCIATIDSYQPEGKFYVCIESEDEKKLYSFESEKAFPNCGFYSDVSQLGQYDFPIFVSLPKYASATNLSISDEDLENFVVVADSYLYERYNGSDCSSKCVLPIKVSGVSQNLEISSAKVDYSTSGLGNTYTTDIFSISDSVPLINFEGVVDLSKLGFGFSSSGSKIIRIDIDGKELVSKGINITLAPTIVSLSPLNAPAGVSTTFRVNATSSKNITGYTWEFGDGKTESTSTNTVAHIYLNQTFYNLRVSVKDNTGAVASKNFTIFVGSPAEIVNSSIASKKTKLQNLSDELATYPSWQADYIKTLIGIESLMTKINELDQKRKTTFSDDELIKLALELNELVVPQSISVIHEITLPFLVNSADVDVTPLKKLSDGNLSGVDISVYKEPVSQWERENVVGTMSVKTFEVMGDNRESSFLMKSYSVSLESSSPDESYFIINNALTNLKSDGSFKFEDSEGFSYLTLAGESKKTFAFATSSNEDLKIYVSPEFSKLPYVAAPEICNFNTFCEKDLGENYFNCRSDCKPLAKTIWFLIVILFFALATYTLLQVWYKNNYEKKLFSDRAHLFNLVSYIDNMLNRDVAEGEIRRRLAEQSWTPEKINYAVKKSKGQRTGMYELIPIEKFLSMKRHQIAKREVRANPTLIPATPRMIMPQQYTNLNKPRNIGPNNGLRDPRFNNRRW